MKFCRTVDLKNEEQALLMVTVNKDDYDLDMYFYNGQAQIKTSMTFDEREDAIKTMEELKPEKIQDFRDKLL